MSSDKLLEVVRRVVGNTNEQQFVPRLRMRVFYARNRAVVNSRNFSFSKVRTAPKVLIGGQPYELYTLVMVDLDAPNPSDTSLQDFASWIVTNIPGGTTCDQGTEFLSYEVPEPDVGVHRTVFVLYKQQSRLDGIETLTSRFRFNTCAFANKHNLGQPVMLEYFNHRREDKKRMSRDEE